MDHTIKQQVAQKDIDNKKKIFYEFINNLQFAEAKKLAFTMCSIAIEHNLLDEYKTEPWYTPEIHVVEGHTEDDTFEEEEYIEASTILRNTSAVCKDRDKYTILKRIGFFNLIRPLYEAMMGGDDRELDPDEKSELVAATDLLDVMGMNEEDVMALGGKKVTDADIEHGLFKQLAQGEEVVKNQYKIKDDNPVGDISTIPPLAAAFIKSGKSKDLDTYIDKYANDISMLSGMLTYLNEKDPDAYNNHRSTITNLIHDAQVYNPVIESRWINFLNK